MEPRVYAPWTSSPSSPSSRGASRTAVAVAGAPPTPTMASATMATNEHRWFAVDDFLRVDDVARGEREWRDVRPCVRRAVEGVAYVLRRHDKAIEGVRLRMDEAEASRRRARDDVDDEEDDGGTGRGKALMATGVTQTLTHEVDALKLELAEARQEASERRVEALEDAVRRLKDELHASRSIHAATLERVTQLEALHASTASKIAVDLFELETQIGVKATEGASAAAAALDARLESVVESVADVTTLVHELEVEVQQTRLSTNQTALSLAAADIPSVVSEMEIIKARTQRATQDAAFVSEALAEVRQLNENVERLSEDCSEDVKRVRERTEDMRKTYTEFKDVVKKSENMENETLEFIASIDAKGREVLAQIQNDVRRVSDLGDEIASTSERHAHLVQEQSETLAAQLKEWGAKVVERVGEKAEATVNEVIKYRMREIESSTDSATARNAERASHETRKCVALAEAAMKKAEDESNAFSENVLSSVAQVKAASERADEMKEWINKQHVTIAEAREESIGAVRNTEKHAVDMLSKISEEHTRAMKRVLGDAEATRGIQDASVKTRIDRLDERFERFESRIAASELRVESVEVSRKLEQASAKPIAEAHATALAAIEKNVFKTLAALEKDLREDVRVTSDRTYQSIRRDLQPIQEAIFGAPSGRGYDANTPPMSPLSTPSKSALTPHSVEYAIHFDIDAPSGSLQSRIAHLARVLDTKASVDTVDSLVSSVVKKQEQQEVIIHSMHRSMERTLKDRPSTTAVNDMFREISARVESLQESYDWEKTDRSKAKRLLTDIRDYVDDRCTKMETVYMRDLNSRGEAQSEQHIHEREGVRYVTYPEFQAGIEICEAQIKRLSRGVVGSDSSSLDAKNNDNLITF